MSGSVTSPNGSAILNGEVGTKYKEVVVTYFKQFSQNLIYGSESNRNFPNTKWQC
jgi:hypothetical protein